MLGAAGTVGTAGTARGAVAASGFSWVLLHSALGASRTATHVCGAMGADGASRLGEGWSPEALAGGAEDVSAEEGAEGCGAVRLDSSALRARLSFSSTSRLRCCGPEGTSSAAAGGRGGLKVRSEAWPGGRGNESRTKSGSWSSVGILLVPAGSDARAADRCASSSALSPHSAELAGISGGKSVTEKMCDAPGSRSAALSSVSSMPLCKPSAVSGALGREPAPALMRLL